MGLRLGQMEHVYTGFLGFAFQTFNYRGPELARFSQASEESGV